MQFSIRKQFGLNGELGSAKNYIAMTKVSWATATRDLQEFVDIGALKRTGELRYHLAIKLFEL
ncbi:MAG: hypothetical protein KDK62_08440 [Chlamydiia bacterium]|nr:hypothetical protein [Chlamydiia bacterium]